MFDWSYLLPVNIKSTVHMYQHVIHAYSEYIANMLNVLFQLLHTLAFIKHAYTVVIKIYGWMFNISLSYIKLLQVAKCDMHHAHKSSAMLPVFIEHLNWLTAEWSWAFHRMTKLALKGANVLSCWPIKMLNEDWKHVSNWLTRESPESFNDEQANFTTLVHMFCI